MSIDSNFSPEGEGRLARESQPSTTSQNSPFRGRTIVKSKALAHVATQVTADALGVKPDNVKVSIHDHESQLGFSLETPLSEADVLRCSLRDDMTVFSLCEEARQTITQRTAHITGHTIGDIDVIIAGVEKQPTEERRVK